jgi:prepilin-type processing-associated H-X9-DG protein
MNLDEIEKRAAAATPGPWKWKKDNLCAPAPYYVVLKPFYDDDTGEVTTCIFANDKDFIARARTDIPDLIAEVKRLVKKEPCGYCMPDENSTYLAKEFYSPKAGERINMMFCDGHAFVTIKRDNEQTFSVPIYYCPMCGRKLETKEADHVQGT